MYQFFSGKDFFGNKLFNQRVSGYFGDDLVLGSFFARILPILIFFTILGGKNFSRKENVFYMFLYFIIYYYLSIGGKNSRFYDFLFLFLCNNIFARHKKIIFKILSFFSVNNFHYFLI